MTTSFNLYIIWLIKYGPQGIRCLYKFVVLIHRVFCTQLLPIAEVYENILNTDNRLCREEYFSKHTQQYNSWYLYIYFFVFILSTSLCCRVTSRVQRITLWRPSDFDKLQPEDWEATEKQNRFLRQINSF